MFAWLRNRKFVNEQRRLERLHLQLLEQARDLQRGGDIRGFAAKTAEAAAVEQQLDAWLASRDATDATSGKG
jgi:Family of unknown function (DUF6435)